jgi:hypothetical protein
MKKAMTVLFAGSLVIGSLSTNAQLNTYAVNATPPVSTVNTVTGRELNSSEVNANALTDFSRNNKSASDVIWTSDENVLSVYYTKDAVKSRTTYNTKGRREYTLRYFNAAQAPKRIVDLITANYPDKTIVLITEVERRGTKYHYVKMEDTKSILTVQVLNGEIDFFEKLDK